MCVRVCALTGFGSSSRRAVIFMQFVFLLMFCASVLWPKQKPNESRNENELFAKPAMISYAPFRDALVARCRLPTLWCGGSFMSKSASELASRKIDSKISIGPSGGSMTRKRNRLPLFLLFLSPCLTNVHGLTFIRLLVCDQSVVRAVWRSHQSKFRGPRSA